MREIKVPQLFADRLACLYRVTAKLKINKYINNNANNRNNSTNNDKKEKKKKKLLGTYTIKYKAPRNRSNRPTLIHTNAESVRTRINAYHRIYKTLHTRRIWMIIINEYVLV